MLVQLREWDAARKSASGLQLASAGGRPRADWWEDLFIELACQLYGGKFHTRTQADIEEAMAKWIAENGNSAGESTIRTRASKLWRALAKA